MRSTTLLALLVVVPAFAAPVINLDGLRQSNRVTQVKVGHRSKYQAAAKAYARYAIAVPPAIQQAAASAVPSALPVAQKNGLVATNTTSAPTPVQSGSVSASPEQYDEAYLSPVTVGHMNMNLDFDTGSSDLWVFSTDLPQAEQGTHNLYMHHYATQNAGESFTVSYGDGSTVSGTVWTDRVIVGGVTAPSQAVEVATSVSSTFATGLSDGLLGLGFDNINQVKPTPVPTFMDNIASSLPANLFTLTLKAGQPGEYDFGFIDPAKYTGTIAYTPVDSSKGYWLFSLDSYAINGASSPTTLSSSEASTIADSGTSINWLPTALVTSYYNLISGAQYSDNWGGMVFPCSATLPDLTLYIGGQGATLPGSLVNYAPLNDGSGNCFGGIQDGSTIGFNILGDTFLKSQFVVFDRSVPQLGFAAQA